MTLLITIVTVVVSYMAFQRPDMLFKYDFNPYQIVHRNQWYRLVSHAFLHANWAHLLGNMFTFYFFSESVIHCFAMLFKQNANLLFVGLYFGGIIISSIYSLIKQRDNYNYSAIGASGGVSSVLFAYILFDPLGSILIFGILPVPCILFGIAYLGYSYYMSKRDADNIAHDAHFYGALYGLIYPLLFRPDLAAQFIDKILP